MSDTLFRPKERLCIEEKYCNNRAYEFLEAFCERALGDEEGEVILYPPELFYMSFYILDKLKCKRKELKRPYCKNRMWDELLFYLKENTSLKERDRKRVVTLVVQGALSLLVHGLAEDGVWHTLINLVDSKGVFRHKTWEAAKTAAYSINGKELENYIMEYMESDELITDEIDYILDDLQAHEPLEPKSEAPFEYSSVRIAPGKKTSVLVVLNAMFKAGWFVDENDRPLPNRDDALNDILRYAFAMEKKTAISQTIKPTSSLSGDEKNERLLRRLFKEDEMKQFIKELQEELFAAYQARR